MKDGVNRWWILTASAALFAFIAIPLFWMLSTSFKTAADVLRYPPVLIPTAPTFENYVNLFKQTTFARYLFNSIMVATCVVIITDLAAVFGGYSIARFRFAGRQMLIISSLLGYMVAPIMIVIPFYIMMRACGLSNTYLSLILAHTSFCLPFALWLMKAYFEEVPVELEKAARVDGASLLQVLLHVVLPLVAPGIGAVSIFVFILSWNDYIFARILITGDSLKTIPIGIDDIYNGTVLDWGMLMAAGILVTLPILVGFALVSRVLMRRLGFSGLK